MKPNLERIDFRADQLLDGCDLAQSSRRTAELLDLHAARGHDVWGVAYGYLCSLDDTIGRVKVGPGIALDAHGRQLVSSTDRLLAVPGIASAKPPQMFDLVARWAETDELSGCGPRGLPFERPDLRWEWAGPAPLQDEDPPPYSRKVHLGTDVPMARLTTATSKTDAVVDTDSRPVAHGLVRPKIATGRVLQSSTKASGTYANWTMSVSTESAGLVSASPVYLVSLDAHPFGDTADLGTGAPPPAGSTQLPELATRLRDWVGPFVSIEDKSSASFSIRVSVIADPSSWARKTSVATNPVPVSWIGIETQDAGPFSGYPIFLISLPIIGGFYG